MVFHFSYIKVDDETKTDSLLKPTGKVRFVNILRNTTKLYMVQRGKRHLI